MTAPNDPPAAKRQSRKSKRTILREFLLHAALVTSVALLFLCYTSQSRRGIVIVVGFYLVVDLVTRLRASRGYVAPEPSPNGIEVEYHGKVAVFRWRWAAFTSVWVPVIISVVALAMGLLLIGLKLYGIEATPAWVGVPLMAGGIALGHSAAIPTWRNSTTIEASPERIEISHGPARAPAPKFVDVPDIESLDHELVGDESSSYEVIVRLRSTGARVVLADFGDHCAPARWLANALCEHLNLKSRR
jgi:hypothetical protein